MTATCPSGHTSAAEDYCDVCGAPVGAEASAGGAAPSVPAQAPPAGSALDLDTPPAGRDCPHCGAQALSAALFCENCGYDFTTGQLPRPGPPRDVSGGVPLVPPPGRSSVPTPSVAGSGPVEWVAEVWVDPDWHAAQEVGEPCPSPGMPVVVGLRGTSLLVGRHSVSRNIHPQVDCGADTGVSRRHAQLTTDGSRWWVEDLRSANGTFVGAAGEALPGTPIPVGQRQEVAEDARVYLGAWTRLVIRPATEQERTDPSLG